MENNELKENIRRKVKEKIAVSNIREEFDMKTSNKRKIIVGTLSACAMFVLCFGIVFNTDTTQPNTTQRDILKGSGVEELRKEKDDKIENQSNNNEQVINKPVEDRYTGEKEPVKDITNKKYPECYGGRYVDNNGSNVIWICENNEANRKEVCKFLGITESKTIFKKAQYSYNYLEELQSKISQKMSNKEIPFVTSSALSDYTNNIKVTVTSNKDEDLKKLKELDTIGGAIEIEYNEDDISKKDLLVKE